MGKLKKRLSLVITILFIFNIFFVLPTSAANSNNKNHQLGFKRVLKEQEQAQAKKLTDTQKNAAAQKNSIKGNQGSLPTKPAAPEYKPDTVIVKYKSGTASTAAVNALEKQMGTTTAKIFKSGAKLLKLSKGSSVPNTIATLKKNNLVAYAEPDYKVTATYTPNDPMFNQLWGMDNESYPQYDVQAPEAWDKTKGSSDTVVAVIDTGVDFTHPELTNCAWTNPGEIPGNGIDDDGDGYVDDVHGWDFVDGDNSVYTPGAGNHPHGTHVSGTIAAAMDNNIGVAGLAPNVKIMALRFLDNSGSGYTDDAISAIDYAAAKGAKVINNSWAGYGYSEALYDAIAAASNSLFVCAAGNDSENNDSSGWASYPASFDLNNIISVASYYYDGERSYFSNYGPTTVDVAAPGSNILSTVPQDYDSYGYETWNGTSMATPHVSATAALVLSRYPDLDPVGVKQKIMNTCDPDPYFAGLTVTGGIVDAAKAVVDPNDEIPGVPYPSSGKTVTGNLDSSGSDLDDVFKIYLPEGSSVQATMKGNGTADYDLYLYSPEATTVSDVDQIVAASENYGPGDETINYTAPYSGYYYIDVFAYAGSGNYTLTATWGNNNGIYDDSSSVLDYEYYEYYNPWNTVTDSNAYNGTYTACTAKGQQVSLSFRGNAIELYSSMLPAMGKARITIDNNPYQDVSLYSLTPNYQQKVFCSGLLAPDQDHTITIECLGQPSGGKKTAVGINLDYLKVLNFPVAENGTIEDSSSSIYYTPSDWTSYAASNFSGGTIKYSNVKGAKAALQFEGSSIQWIALKSASYGIANVYIDNSLAGTVDLYSPSAAYKQAVFTQDGLAAGYHTIQIECTGNKSSGATGAKVNVDAFVVGDTINPPTAPTNLSGTYASSAINLTWAPDTVYGKPGTSSAPLDHYVVYRSADLGATYSDIAHTTDCKYTDSAVSAGEIYYYKVNAVSGTGVISDYTNVAQVGAGTVATAGVVQDDNSAVLYQGTWTPAANSSFSGGTLRLSDSSNAKASLIFKGTGITWTALQSTTYGITQVYIDGALQGSIDLYSASAKFKQDVYSISGLTSGLHKIAIVRTGTKNSSSSGTKINLDAFTVK